MQALTNRDGDRFLQPDNKCTKTRSPVLEVLQDKHPALHDPPIADGAANGTFKKYDEGAPAVIPIVIRLDTVECVAAKLSGMASLGGTDTVDLRNWLLCFGAELEAFREEMASWTTWLVNKSPPWPAYRTLMAGQLVALDKQPGV